MTLAASDNVQAAIFAGAATIIASTIVVVVSRYYESKREREAAHRDKKIELYDKFLSKLFEIFLGGNEKKQKPEELVPFLREVQRQLILWAGPETIKAYAEWHKELTTTPSQPHAKQMIKMIDFFLALRKDLGHSNSGIEQSHIARFMLKNSDFFMQKYHENPNITMTEIARLEEESRLTSESKNQAKTK
jgi:hypothetical protein